MLKVMLRNGGSCLQWGVCAPVSRRRLGRIAFHNPSAVSTALITGTGTSTNGSQPTNALPTPTATTCRRHSASPGFTGRRVGRRMLIDAGFGCAGFPHAPKIYYSKAGLPGRAAPPLIWLAARAPSGDLGSRTGVPLIFVILAKGVTSIAGQQHERRLHRKPATKESRNKMGIPRRSEYANRRSTERRSRVPNAETHAGRKPRPASTSGPQGGVQRPRKHAAQLLNRRINGGHCAGSKREPGA